MLDKQDNTSSPQGGHGPSIKATRKKKLIGRPTVVTEDVVSKLEEAFSWGCSDIEACLWADIAPATLYKHQERHPEFAERKAELKENPILLARKSVVNALPKDSKLAMDFLSRKKKDEFSQRSELTGKDGDDIGVKISADQAEQLIRARAKRTDI